MAGKPWSEERRRRQSEITRRQMACPARREFQRQVMKKVRRNPEVEIARQKATYTQEWRARASGVLIRVRSDPKTEKKRKENARQAALAMNAKKRGGAIPGGYEVLYFKLRKTHKIPAAESLRITRAQRGADLRAR